MPFEIERKYLIRRPSETLLRSLPQADPTEITQTYLQADGSGMMRRVRKRGSDAKGWQYTYTRKQNAGFGKRIELEDEITALEDRIKAEMSDRGVEELEGAGHIAKYTEYTS